MADPVILDAAATNACALCAGNRQLAEMSWRSPTFSVTCLGCGQIHAGESAEEAVELWNAANPDRVVDVAEKDAMRQRQTTALVTGFAFLDTVRELAELHVDMPPSAIIVPFLQWCESQAS